jgi:hypothetical protein
MLAVCFGVLHGGIESGKGVERVNYLLEMFEYIILEYARQAV